MIQFFLLNSISVSILIFFCNLFLPNMFSFVFLLYLQFFFLKNIFTILYIQVTFQKSNQHFNQMLNNFLFT